MTPEDTKYYDAFFDLFNTDGWKQFIDETKGAYSVYQIENLNSEKELFFAKGERSTLQRVIGFQTGIEAAYASITEENKES
tara:strand:+ start:417 stop:659 length:243 start_codon:yes stop_codon:yes gene_type:complete